MSDRAVVPVSLDVREYTEPLDGPDAYRALWDRVEPYLLRVDPREPRPLRLDLGPEGSLTLQFLDPVGNPDTLGPGHRFAVRGIRERPQIRYACAHCARQGTTEYGPFRCHACHENPAGATETRLCDRHVVILDGPFRTVCPAHAPTCPECAKPGTFWCDGATCRKKQAWCDDHRRAHPGDARTSYCPGCYAVRFPDCAVGGCANTGHLRCEYTASAGGRCRNRTCAGHAGRWQIYGPHKRGLVVCPEHWSGLRRLSREDLVFQIVAATAARRRLGERSSVPAVLPRLSVVRHILIHVRNEALDMGVIDGLFTGLRKRLGSGRDDAAMARLVDDHARTRAQDLRVFEDEHAQGRRHFAALVRLLAAEGKQELADRITFSDFRSKANKLFVRVPEEYKGRFIGRGGAGIAGLSRRLGIILELEKR